MRVRTIAQAVRAAQLREWLSDIFASGITVKCYELALYMRLMGMIP